MRLYAQKRTAPKGRPRALICCRKVSAAGAGQHRGGIPKIQLSTLLPIEAQLRIPVNPNGILSHSPRLRYPATLG